MHNRLIAHSEMGEKAVLDRLNASVLEDAMVSQLDTFGLLKEDGLNKAKKRMASRKGLMYPSSESL